jgi:DNA mismatch repair protein MSH2
MEKLRMQVEQDLGVSKKVELVESNMHTFVFEVDKKEGDDGMRKSS